MADGSGKQGSDPPEHPYVERLRPDPSQPPRPVVTLMGLLGRSDRAGYQRLYFTRDLGTYAEFPSADVLFVEPVSASESPLKGIDASRISLNRDADVRYTRSTKASTTDAFDLNVRTARATGGQRLAADPGEGDPPIRADDPVRITVRTCFDDCTDTCRTVCRPATCETCHTQCGTCQTCAGQNTCQTCQTQCGTCQTCAGQNTCHTCQTVCGRTCITCDTCNPHVPTCNPRCIV